MSGREVKGVVERRCMLIVLRHRGQPEDEFDRPHKRWPYCTSCAVYIIALDIWADDQALQFGERPHGPAHFVHRLR